MLTDALLVSLFDGQPHVLASLLADWLASSRRFAAFVSANETKIRKKLRSTRGLEALRDLQLELETAYLLLRERSLSLVYEPQLGRAISRASDRRASAMSVAGATDTQRASAIPVRRRTGTGRHPDFAVSYTTSLVFMVEVTRVRGGRASAAPDANASGVYDRVCSKLRQLAQHSCNVLVVGMQAEPPDASELRSAMLRFQQRAEANDPAIVQRPGFRDRSEFFQYYYRLSGILMRRAPLQSGDPIVLWDNPQGKYPLPSRVRTALSRSHSL